MTIQPLIGLLTVILAQAAPENPIEGLQSPSPEVRSRSRDLLEAQGLSSLPALRTVATTGSRDAARLAESLITRIGASRLRRGSLVSLNVEPMPVLDAIRHLAQPTGANVSMWIDPDSRWRFDKVSMNAPERRPFFEAIDRLGASYGFRAGAASPVAHPANAPSRFVLVERTGAMPPTSYDGPYRVSLIKITRHRTSRLEKAPTPSAVSEDFHALLEIAAEPGISIQPNGEVRLEEVVDDRGQDLRSSLSPSPGPTEILAIPDTTDQIQILVNQVNLRLPDDPGSTISRMRGFVPIVAMCRTDEIFSLPLEKLQPRTISAGGVTMQIHRASMEGPVKVLDVTVQGEPPPSPTLYASGPRQMTQAVLQLPFNLADHLRVEDRTGQPLGVLCVPSAPPGRDGSMSYRIQIPARAPHSLIYYGVAGIAAELPFDFRGLPIP